MRILIVADIHANPWALAAVEREARSLDHVLFAGDAVNYGPRPCEAVAWLRERGAAAVRGNHDHAVAFRADPRASASKQPIALAMRDWTHEQLSDDDRRWLGERPLTLSHERGGVVFALCHATPADPLYDYRLTPDAADELLREAVAGIRADVLVLGHTHRPMIREHGGTLVVNPGSVGQPLDGDPRAAFAVWEDGRVALRRAEYDVERTIAAVSSVPIRADHARSLIHTLQTGRMETECAT